MDKVKREFKTKKIGEEQEQTFVNGIANVRKENAVIERCSVRTTNGDLEDKKKFTINIPRQNRRQKAIKYKERSGKGYFFLIFENLIKKQIY